MSMYTQGIQHNAWTRSVGIRLGISMVLEAQLSGPSDLFTHS